MFASVFGCLWKAAVDAWQNHGEDVRNSFVRTVFAGNGSHEDIPWQQLHSAMPHGCSTTGQPLQWVEAVWKITEEEADEVEKLFHMGLTFYAIIDRFGWKSTSRVKNIIRDRKLVR